MTVSRVVNGEPSVRPGTRERVLKAIGQLGYAPNQAARNLAGANQIRIGLLYSNPSAAYLSEFLLGSLERAHERNIQFVVEKCDPGSDAGKTVSKLVAAGIDGIVLPPPLSDAPLVKAILESTDTPTVAVATSGAIDKFSIVSVDDHQAALAMTRHIISLGHTRIGFIIGDPNQVASTRRLEGFRDGLAEAGLELPEAYLVQGDFTYRSGLDAAEKLLDLDEVPTAIFASNDDMAAAAVAMAHRRGLDVPGDLTVCGFDDTSLATTVWPELTTIHQPIVDMSRAAVDLVLTKIRKRRSGSRETNQHQVLDFTLVRRSSDGPPRTRPPRKQHSR